MAIRDLEKPTDVIIRIETCTVDPSLMYLEIGDENAESGFGYLTAADRQWLREQLAKWDQ